MYSSVIEFIHCLFPPGTLATLLQNVSMCIAPVQFSPLHSSSRWKAIDLVSIVETIVAVQVRAHSPKRATDENIVQLVMGRVVFADFRESGSDFTDDIL